MTGQDRAFFCALTPVMSLVAGSTGVLALTPGCSVLFTRPLPRDYEHLPDRQSVVLLECSTSRVPPLLDTLLSASNVVGVLYVASQDSVTNKGEAAAVGLSVAAFWALSAWYGYSNTSECEIVKRALTDEDEPSSDTHRYRPSQPRLQNPAPPTKVTEPQKPLGAPVPAPPNAPGPGTPGSRDASPTAAPDKVVPVAAPKPSVPVPQQAHDDEPWRVRIRSEHRVPPPPPRPPPPPIDWQ